MGPRGGGYHGGHHDHDTNITNVTNNYNNTNVNNEDGGDDTAAGEGGDAADPGAQAEGKVDMVNLDYVLNSCSIELEHTHLSDLIGSSHVN